MRKVFANEFRIDCSSLAPLRLEKMYFSLIFAHNDDFLKKIRVHICENYQFYALSMALNVFIRWKLLLNHVVTPIYLVYGLLTLVFHKTRWNRRCSSKCTIEFSTLWGRKWHTQHPKQHAMPLKRYLTLLYVFCASFRCRCCCFLWGRGSFCAISCFLLLVYEQKFH